MPNKVTICGVKIDNVNMQEALNTVESFLKEDSLHLIFTPNSEIIMNAKRNESLKAVLNSASLMVADGAGVVMASKILGSPLKEKVAGFDLITNMFKSPNFQKKTYFFLGGKPSIAQKAADNIHKDYGINILGVIDGYFKPEDNKNIVNTINKSNADILLVALGAPKQEQWLFDNRYELNSKICIGVGGSFDVFAGVSQRAPIFFQKYSLEWLYRLIKEPWRYKRMLDLPRFILYVTMISIQKTIKKLMS